jgi:hypothetical protein
MFTSLLIILYHKWIVYTLPLALFQQIPSQLHGSDTKWPSPGRYTHNILNLQNFEGP